MFSTILRGQVARQNWGKLQSQYEKLIQTIPDGLMETFLIQNRDQPTLWQVVTLWQNEEIYEQARSQKKTEACEMLFCDAGTVPERSCFHVRRGFERI